MGISWSQGLLAGAAGVAEYSDQQQRVRQSRLDKTTALENDMAMIQAKSRYAQKMNEYKDNKKQLNALKGVRSGGFDEQVRLFQTLGYSPKDSMVRATQAMQGVTERLKRPTEMDEPTLNFKSKQAGRAKSPLQNWAEAYMKPADVAKEPTESLQKFINEPQGSLTPAGGKQEPEAPEAPEGQIEAQSIGGQEFTPDPSFTNPLAAADELETIKISGSKGRQKGKWISSRNKRTGEMTNRQFWGSGETSDKLVDPAKEVNPDGSVSHYTRTMDVRGKISRTGETWKTKLAPDGKKKEVTVELPTRENYIKMPSEAAKGQGQIRGQFYTDFPDAERELWSEMKAGTFNFFSANEAPENFEESMADAMLFIKNRQAPLVPETLLDKPEDMTALNDRWKAMAYVKVMQEEGVIEAVASGAIKPETFFGPKMNSGLPRITRIQQAILGMDEYKKDSEKWGIKFTNSTQF